MIEVVEVTPQNIQDKGFFCMRSKPKSQGYQNKLSWLLKRFDEGLKLKMIEEDGYPRGFIEYIPIENAWRAVSGANYLLIHCLWIVGRGKGKGYGSTLLNECINDARRNNKSGIAIVTSSQTWLSDKPLFVKNGFESIDQAPPHFELLVKKLDDDQPVPKFNHGWDDRIQKYHDGITIFKSDQCPYIDDSVQAILEVANERNIQTRVITYEDSEDARYAPSAYGVFNVVFNGKLLTYHPVTKRDMHKLLDSMN